MPFLVVYATEFISPLTWGVLMSASVLLLCLLPLPFGMLADARGRVALYVGGVAMLGVSYILFSLGGLLWFVLFTALMSLGMAMYQAQQSAIMADIVESRVRGRIMGGYLFTAYVSGMVGGALGGYIYGASNPLPFIICGVLFLASALLLSLVFRKS
jgi:MFS family permease